MPVKQLKRKRDEPICEVAKLMKSVIANNSTKELIDFMREDLDKAREHELRLMQMMMSLGNQQVQNTVLTMGHIGYPSHGAHGGFPGHCQPHTHHSHPSAFYVQAGHSGYLAHPVSHGSPSQSDSSSTSSSSPHVLSDINDNTVYHSF